jgi:protein-S-isoprenylcysteine O-methyltransferase Ste14
MYLGIIILFLCSPIALGSFLGIIPGGIIGILFTLRTYREDKMPGEELPGYKEYAQQVNYRLFPRIW